MRKLPGETEMREDCGAPLRRANRASRLAFTTALGLFCAAEIVGVFISASLGMAAQALLLALLLLGYALFDGQSAGHGLAVLSLLPLLRILSLTLPVPGISQVYWYPEIGAPLLLAMVLVIRRSRVSWPRLARPREWWPQVVIALSGFPLAVVAYVILRPERLWGSSLAPLGALAVSVSFFSAGVVEELLFRGMVQGAVAEHFGDVPAVLIGAPLFACCYLGTLSPLFVLFATDVGLLFGTWVERTGSVWGVAVAHGLLTLVALLVLPILGG